LAVAFQHKVGIRNPQDARRDYRPDRIEHLTREVEVTGFMSYVPAAIPFQEASGQERLVVNEATIQCHQPATRLQSRFRKLEERECLVI
jgi:hypothetical protein